MNALKIIALFLIAGACLPFTTSNANAEEDEYKLLYSADEQQIIETEAFIAAVYRRHYKGGKLEIEILNEAEIKMPIVTIIDKNGQKENYIVWEFRVWWREEKDSINLTRECYNHGVPATLDTKCSYNQPIEIHYSSLIQESLE